jgi:hypothetical protein
MTRQAGALHFSSVLANPCSFGERIHVKHITYTLWRIGRMNGKQFACFMSAAYFAIGFAPITALAMAIIGVVPLAESTLLMVLPATLLGIGLGVWFPAYGKLALKGLLIGLVAVFLYDGMRIPFILSGIWGDFIPKINMLLFNTSTRAGILAPGLW